MQVEAPSIPLQVSLLEGALAEATADDPSSDHEYGAINCLLAIPSAIAPQAHSSAFQRFPVAVLTFNPPPTPFLHRATVEALESELAAAREEMARIKTAARRQVASLTAERDDALAAAAAAEEVR